MDMIRINENGFFRGSFPIEFLEQHSNDVINGELVSEWILIEAYEPEKDKFFEAKWDGGKWIEGLEKYQIDIIVYEKIEEINRLYTSKISDLVAPYVEKSFIDGIPMPQEILDERIRLKNECKSLINNIENKNP